MERMTSRTIEEIRKNPDAVKLAEKVTSEYLSQSNSSLPSKVMYTGCGSSHFLSQLLAMATTGAGGKGKAAPCSELFLERRYYPLDVELTVITSRSGETTEALKVAEMGADLKIPTMAVTAYESSLSKKTSQALVVPAHEESVVMTHSFTAFYLAFLELIKRSYMGEDIDFRSLYSAVKRALREEGTVRRIIHGTEFNSVIYLGTGILYPVALEASLKMKEMAILWSEAHPTFEFRHGFKAIAGKGTLVVILTMKPIEWHERLAKELHEQGATVLGISHEDFGTDLFLQAPEINEMETPAVYLPIIQLLAYYKAVSRGLNPDKPRFLSKVVRW